MSTSQYATVLAWQDALNAGDIDTIIELSNDAIEISSATGGSQGLIALLDWVAEADTTIALDEAYVNGSIVVTAGEAAGTFAGDPEGEHRHMAIAFRVEDDQVVSVFIHPDLETALKATGLGAEDLVEA